MFLGIEFWTIGREEKYPELVRKDEFEGVMPSGAVHHHDEIFIRMALGDFIKEDLHAFRVDVGQDQRIEVAIERTDGAVGVGVLVGRHGLDDGTQGFFAPTSASPADSSESSLILEEHTERTFLREAQDDFCQFDGEFFFQSSRAFSSPLGCRVSGASLRKP